MPTGDFPSLAANRLRRLFIHIPFAVDRSSVITNEGGKKAPPRAHDSAFFCTHSRISDAFEISRPGDRRSKMGRVTLSQFDGRRKIRDFELDLKTLKITVKERFGL